METPARLFTLYAQEDESFVEQLTAQLSLLRRKGLVKDFYDKEISPADEWDEQTHLNFTDCNYLLFLVSPALLVSDYYQKPEIEKAFSMREGGNLKIIPILIRNCDFSKDPLNQFELLPVSGQSVESASWGNRELAWQAVTDGLKEILTGEKPVTKLVVPVAVSTTKSFVQAPTRRGLGWPLQILLGLVLLAVMGGISYYVVNYEPADNAAAAINSINVADTISIPESSEIFSAPIVPVEEEPRKKAPTPKSNIATKAARDKRATAKSPKDTPPHEVPDTVAKSAELPSLKAPSIKSAQLEQMLFDFSQGKVNISDFSPYLCNQLETSVRFDKKSMSFQQMCTAIQEVKAKKIKKITVVSTSFDGSCISGMEVTLKKKGLFN